MLKKAVDRADKAKKRTAESVKRLQMRTSARQATKAFPGDTYIADLKQASSVSKPWMNHAFLIVFLSVVADYVLLQDAFAYLFDTGSDSSIIGFAVGNAIPIAFIFLYLFFAHIAGKKFAEYRALYRRGDLVAGIVFASFVFLILAFIAFIRYYSLLHNDAASIAYATGFESGGFGAGESAFSGGSGDIGNGFSNAEGNGFGNNSTGSQTNGIIWFDSESLIQTLGLVAVMFLGALLTIVRSYYRYDVYAAEKAHLAETHIAEDRRLYEQTYFEYAANAEKSLEYERLERDLDKQAVDCSFRINELVAQLNGILDPADSHDFRKASRLFQEELFKERS